MTSRFSTSSLVLALAFWWSGIAAAVLVRAQGPADGQPPNASTPSTYQPPGYTDDDYGYGARLTPEERDGRDTWYFWTGGNETFWVEMARKTQGNVDLLNYIDSRRHGLRFRTLGAITQPGCRAATAPDQYGLWIDTCDQAPVPGVPGDPTNLAPDFITDRGHTFGAELADEDKRALIEYLETL